MYKNKSLSLKIWEIAYPVLMYYTAISIGSFVGQMFFGSGVESYMLCKMVGSLVAMYVVYIDYKNDLIFTGQYGVKEVFTRDKWVNLGFIVVITLFLSVALNNMISMSPLVQMSEAYQDASEAFYGTNIGIELLVSALIAPVLEELVHRGVVYGRLRRMIGLWPAVLVSALIFAVLHFNIVQFIYAFLLGIVFALFVEESGKLYPAIVAHIAANTFAVIRTETNILTGTVDGSISAWLISVGCLLIGIGVLFIYLEKQKK